MATRLLRNIWPKAAALVLAILTWWGVRQTIETTEVFDYQVRLVLSPDVVVSSISPKVFEVTISGPNETIRAFHNLKHEYVIDLTETREGKTLLATIDSTRIELLPELVIESFSHEAINIELDVLVQKELPVVLEITGEPAPGYAVGETFVLPSHKLLELPQEAAKGISQISTAPIDVTDRSETIVDRAGLVDPIDKTKRLETYVDVTILIEPELIDKEFNDIPVLLMRSPDDDRDVTIENDKISVTLRGRADIMETFDKSDIKVYIDITEQKAGEYDLAPLVEPIEGIVSVKPDAVRYAINP
jgi:hypothetical protein